MNLMEITTSGFKNLGKTTINFSNSHITSLIAPNNYGKSNFLESLSFSYDFIQANPKQKKEMMEYFPAIPINKHLDQTNFYFSVLFEKSSNSHSNFVNYEFEFEWQKDKKKVGARIVSESLKVKENKPNSKYSTLIKRYSNSSMYQSSPTARCNSKIKIASNNLLINKLVNNDDLFYREILEDILSLSFSITNLMEVEPAFGAIQVFGPDSKIDDNELRDGHNISKFLYNLKKNKNDLYELLINSVKDLIPTIEMIDPVEHDLKKMSKEDNFKDVPFTLPEKLYDLRIREFNNNQTTSVRYVSRGTKRILLVLATAIDASEKNITLLAFEELENSIHPHLLQKLLMILIGIVPNLKILISSHSPYLIQYLPINSIYLGIPNDKGLSCFYKLKESKGNHILKLASEEETTLGDYLFDLMSQKSLESEFQREYFEQCNCSQL